MKILAIDTTSEFGSLAIRSQGVEIAKRTIHSTDGFGHRIFAEIEMLRNEAKLASFRDIDCFAAASGPGSFTGVRVSLSVIKGLAEAFGKPAVGISNLRAVSSFGKTERRAVILDARRGDFYVAVYDESGRLLMPETVTKLPKWLEALPDFEYGFVSQNRGLVEPVLLQSRFAGRPMTEAPRELASAVAELAEADGRDGWLDPAAIDANYVRRSDAEMSWSDR